jgi:hypothetical protein
MNFSASASWARQSAQHLDGGGFTSAVRTQKTEDLTFANTMEIPSTAMVLPKCLPSPSKQITGPIMV